MKTILVIVVLVVACSPPCELRQIIGCRHNLMRVESGLRAEFDYNGNVHYVPYSEIIPESWELLYADGWWPRRVGRELCQEEGGRHRYELRDGRFYSYHDAPVLECKSAG